MTQPKIECSICLNYYIILANNIFSLQTSHSKNADFFTQKHRSELHNLSIATQLSAILLA